MITRALIGTTFVFSVLETACGSCARDENAQDGSRRVEPSAVAASHGSRDAGTEEAIDAGPPPRIVARRFRVNVHAEPAFRSSTIGYLRAGSAVSAAQHTPASRVGCPEGWYELVGGGFVCDGRGADATYAAELPEPPIAQPRRGDKLPYRYGRIARDRVPMYRRLPTDEEAAEFEGYRIPGRDAGVPEDQEANEASPATVATGPEGASAESPSAGQSNAQADQDQSPASDEEAIVDAGVPTLETLQGEGVVRRWLMRGFYASLDVEMETGEAGRRPYWRTLDNGFIPARRVGRVEGSDFAGIALDGEQWVLPIGYLTSPRSPAFIRQEVRGRVRVSRQRPPGYHHVFRIEGEDEIGGRTYVRAPDGRLFLPQDVVRIEVRERPAEITSDEKWIDVNLENQSLVAYEGDRPVFATLISSGRRTRDDEPENFETPTGTFRVESKHITHTMDGDTAIDGPYSIDDVPYAMYFRRAYAFHAAFWHNMFGRRKSHGCVNLSPRDAQWLFNWAGPTLPDGWHGVIATEQNPGTIIVIRD